MTLAWFRDLVIVIWGLGATVGVIIIVTLAVMLYLKVRPIIDSIKSVTATVKDISTSVEEVFGPVVGIAAAVQGFRKTFGLTRRDDKKKKRERG